MAQYMKRPTLNYTLGHDPPARGVEAHVQAPHWVGSRLKSPLGPTYLPLSLFPSLLHSLPRKVKT